MALLACTPALAQDQDDQNQIYLGDIIVTAAVRQGGAQDIRHFRQTAATGMPRPEMLTVEGLMGEHDLTIAPPPIPATRCSASLRKPCPQTCRCGPRTSCSSGWVSPPTLMKKIVPPPAAQPCRRGRQVGLDGWRAAGTGSPEPAADRRADDR
ncbi:hypothetical protein ACFSTD_06630 [Novosphingobium colocasiae]